MAGYRGDLPGLCRPITAKLEARWVNHPVQTQRPGFKIQDFVHRGMKRCVSQGVVTE